MMEHLGKAKAQNGWGLTLNKKENMSQVPASISLCFLTTAASSSYHHCSSNQEDCTLKL